MSRILTVAALAAALAACNSPGREPGRAALADTAAALPPVTIPAAAATADTARAAVRQVVYVPVYSHIYSRDQRRTFNLVVTLSIRNTDPEYPITVGSVLYYDTSGKLLRRYLSRPLRLGPMATTEYVVAEDDTSGGSGANFLVEWTAQRHVTEPVIEAVMIGTASQQGISFTSVGRPLVRR